MTGAVAGLLAGTSTLGILCANLDMWHIPTAHLWIAVLGAPPWGFVMELNVEISPFSRSAN